MLKPPDSHGEPPPDERPIGELVQQLVDDGKAYAKAELDLVRAIANAKGKALVLPASFVFAAMLFAQSAITVFAVGVFFELYRVMDPVLAGLIALVLFAAIAGGLAWYALRRLKRDL